jgi:hypothetical protein
MHKYAIFQKGFRLYLLYTLLEVSIIISGVYLGIYLDDWVKEQEDKQLEKKYFVYLVQDLERDIALINDTFIQKYDRKMEGLTLAKSYATGRYKPKNKDKNEFISKIGYGAVFSTGLPAIYKGTYRELLNTGNLSLIKNDKLRKKISDYYSFTDQVIRLQSQSYSGYLLFINGLRPFNHNHPNNISQFDKKRLFKKLKTDNFLTIVNLEITFSYKIIIEVKKIKSDAETLIKAIQLLHIEKDR